MNKQLGFSTHLVISFTVMAVRNYFGTQIQHELDHMLAVRQRATDRNLEIKTNK
jgi:hypothetical protein